MERQRGADDPLGPAMGPRVQLVVDGRLLLSLIQSGRPVAKENCLVGGFYREQEVEAPHLQQTVMLSLICAAFRRRSRMQGHYHVAVD